jgi:hypothetical protein
MICADSPQPLENHTIIKKEKYKRYTADEIINNFEQMRSNHEV